jgi:hypothetical protein
MWFSMWYTDNKARPAPWVTKEELKDNKQLFSLLLRQEEEMGLHWSRGI